MERTTTTKYPNGYSFIAFSKEKVDENCQRRKEIMQEFAWYFDKWQVYCHVDMDETTREWEVFVFTKPEQSPTRCRWGFICKGVSPKEAMEKVIAITTDESFPSMETRASFVREEE